MGNKFVKKEYVSGPPGPRGLQGPKGDCDSEIDTNLPVAPAYLFPECGVCEYVDKEKVCENVITEDKFYILAVKNDNTTYWKEIDL